MFTGIVKEIGAVEAIERTDAGARLRVAASFAPELAEGDSVAVDGVCLTATAVRGAGFDADAMNQTLGLSALGALRPGDPVNLEPALRAGEPLGGHIVQGHVDGVGVVARVVADGFARRLTVALPSELRRYVVERGSVGLAGVSLTVSALTGEGLEVSLIPETLERTTLSAAEAGARLNIEVDIVARYVGRMLQGFEAKGS